MENINRTKSAGEEQKMLYEAPDRTSTANDAAAKKKLMIVGGLAGVVTLVGVILIIVFATQKSKPGPTPTPDKPYHFPVVPAPGIPDPPPPPPPAPVTPAFRHYNPYEVTGTPVTTAYSQSGQMKGTYPASGELLAYIQQEALETDQDGAQPISEIKDGADPTPELKSIGVDMTQIQSGDNNKEATVIDYSFDMVGPKALHMVFGDSTANLIPESVIPRPDTDKEAKLTDIGFSTHYGTVDGKVLPLYFNVTADDKPEHNWVSTYDCTLVAASKYIQMDFILPSDEIYGFGERVHETKLTQGAWTMWNKNKQPEADDGFGKGRQSYGTHPFLLYKNPATNKFGGVFFRNANNQAPIVVFSQNEKTKYISTNLSYITTGGQVEAYFFVDGTAEEIIMQYQKMFGMPSLPPFYSLGWQQSGDDYLKHTDVEAVMKGYSDAGMPLDSVWLPFATQYKGLPFTIDNGVFMQDDKTGASITAWKVDALDSKNVKLISRTHPAFQIDPEFNLWNLLNQNDALVKTTVNTDKSKYLTANTAITEQANFPDFMHPKAREVWTFGLESLQSQVSYDGISIEEDGPYTLKCDGECPGKTPDPSPPQFQELFGYKAADKDTIYTGWYQSYKDQKPLSTYNLPFQPGFEGGLFDSQTISLNSTMSDTTMTHKMYDVRNMYGLMMAQSTFDTYKSKVLPVGDRRPLIYSQSTFSTASSKVSHHIAAPVARSWDWLRYSVAQMLNMNILGVPMTGVDVCGTMGTVDEELCAYWYQLAVFSPVARNNYISTGTNTANEPYTITDATNKALIKTAMLDRMRILRYMYTELFKVTVNGGALIKPMFFDHPADSDALKDVEQDFMVGDYVKVSPLLAKADVAKFTSYFPTATGEKWVNIFDPTVLVSTTPDAPDAKEADKKYQRAELAAGDHVNAFLMPGAIIPMQASTYMDGDNEMTVQTSTDLMEKVNLDLLVNLNANGEAKGEVLIDDGFSQDMLDQKLYDYYTFTYSNGNLRKEFAINEGSSGLPDSVTQTTRMLNSITFANVAGKTFDFMCVNAFHGGQLGLIDLTKTVSKDTAKSALTFTLSSPINLYEIHGIYIGDSSKETNLCTVQDTKWVAKTVPDLAGKTSATVQLTSTDAADKTVVNVDFQLLDTFSVAQFQDVSVKISIDKAPYTPFMAKDVLSDHASSKATTGDLSQRVKITAGSATAGEAPFSFAILSDEDHMTAIWDSKDHNIYISEYLMIWGSYLYTGLNVDFTPAFGLGERVDDFWLSDGVYSFWNRNSPNEEETHDFPAKNSYGTHPYIAWKTRANTFSSMFVMNTAANDVELISSKLFGYISMNQISVGGTLDFYISEARKPDVLVQQYHQLVGTPQLPPQWMLGWNQAKLGYKTLDDVKAVIDNYAKDKIPLEAIWNDISYMENVKDFTIDPTNYMGLGDFVANTMHAKNQKYVPIVNAAIPYTPNDAMYTPYADGIKDKVFINEFSNKMPFVGQALAGEVVYPDWTQAKTQAYWEAQLTKFQSMVAFDALWLSGNEAANFCNGPCTTEQTNPTSVELSVPYWPTGRNLNYKTIDVNAVHASGELELEMHNVFSLQQVKATHTWFQNKKMRTALASRSSFAGQGKFGARDYGDNFSTVQDMMLSVPAIMMMNVFGLPTGAPNVCGFAGNTSPELCARWTKLSTFYPFAKNHNAGSMDQEPYAKAFMAAYPDAQMASTTYSQIMIQAIKERYQLIPYLYSNLIRINQEGGVYFKPLFFEYPEDMELYDRNYNDFLLGDDLKVSIETSNLGTKRSEFYFPNGRWCSLWAMTEPCLEITGDPSKGAAQANEQNLVSTADVSHIHAKVGSIVPTANLKSMDAIMTTTDMRMKPTDLHVFPMLNGAGNQGFQAFNKLFYTDDGENFDSTDLSKGTVNGYQFYMTADPSSENFVIQVSHKVKATSATDQTCMNMSMNDFLGEIYVHNADGVGIHIDEFFGIIEFKDGSTRHIIQGSDISYIKNGDQKLVLTVAQQFTAAKTKGGAATPLCLGNIKEIRILKDIDALELLE